MKVGVFKDPCWRAIKTKLRRRNGETIKTMALTIFKEEQLGNQSTRQLGTESLPQDSKNKSSQQRQADSAAGAAEQVNKADTAFHKDAATEALNKVLDTAPSTRQQNRQSTKKSTASTREQNNRKTSPSADQEINKRKQNQN
jgi:hypothetical protein